jgi:hypothetical protein
MPHHHNHSFIFNTTPKPDKYISNEIDPYFPFPQVLFPPIFVSFHESCFIWIDLFRTKNNNNQDIRSPQEPKLQAA